MRITGLPLGLTIGLCIACAPADVVKTPAPIPVAGARVRYAGWPDTTEFVIVRLIALDADSLVFERFIPGEPKAGALGRSDVWAPTALPARPSELPPAPPITVASTAIDISRIPPW
ncbi:MAG TPA: hypothetical protein VFM14_07905 [Gemmatimonadales bacterium]|nr:hypothetical protein [Gemmatimonadales bacterium]